MKTHNRIAQLLTAVAMVQLAACSVPLQVPVQTKPQQESTFIDQLRQLAQSRAQQSAALEPAKAPETYPQVNWPALGAGDFAQAQPQWLVGPVKDIQVARVNWPALGAGDFEMIPAALPQVNWPALGAGDFETMRPVPVAGINPNIVIPELLTTVVWPETAAPRPVSGAGIDPNIVIPELLSSVVWPALGAGDFETVQPALPKVNWPAPGAGDFEAIPAALPKVNWPALGAGDFAQPQP